MNSTQFDSKLKTSHDPDCYTYGLNSEEVAEIRFKLDTMDAVAFSNIVIRYIDSLNGIDTKVDYPEEYVNGYNDACVAIKNTINTLLSKQMR